MCSIWISISVLELGVFSSFSEVFLDYALFLRTSSNLTSGSCSIVFIFISSSEVSRNFSESDLKDSVDCFLTFWPLRGSILTSSGFFLYWVFFFSEWSSLSESKLLKLSAELDEELYFLTGFCVTFFDDSFVFSSFFYFWEDFYFAELWFCGDFTSWAFVFLVSF